MPKRIGDLNKGQRLLLIRRIIEQFGELDIDRITDEVSLYCRGKLPKDFKRRIYDDINNLLQINEIEEHEWRDSGLNKRTFSLIGQPSNVVGSAILKKLNCSFFFPFKRKIHWAVGNQPWGNDKKLRLIFLYGDQLVNISISNDDFPATLIFSRTIDPTNLGTQRALERVKLKYGERVSFLTFPEAYLVSTSYKTDGQLVLQISKEGLVSLIEPMNTAKNKWCDNISKDSLIVLHGLFGLNIPSSFKYSFWSKEVFSNKWQPFLNDLVLNKEEIYAVSLSEKFSLIVSQNDTFNTTASIGKANSWHRSILDKVK